MTIRTMTLKAASDAIFQSVAVEGKPIDLNELAYEIVCDTTDIDDADSEEFKTAEASNLLLLTAYYNGVVFNFGEPEEVGMTEQEYYAAW